MTQAKVISDRPRSAVTQAKVGSDAGQATGDFASHFSLVGCLLSQTSPK